MLGKLKSLFSRQRTIYENFEDPSEPIPVHEISSQWAIGKIDAINNKLLQDRALTLPGDASAFNDYKLYILNFQEAQRIHVTLTKDQNIKPSVAAYALLSTDCASIDAAIDFIFEKSQTEDRKFQTMQHTFIPYLPVKTAGTEIEQEEEPQEEEKKGEIQDDEDKSVELSDIELGGLNQARKK